MHYKFSASSHFSARVAYKTVEWQLKIQQIPFTHVSPSYGLPITLDLAHTQSSLVRSIPGICVQSKDILSGVPAAEAAMPNIRVVALRWWSGKEYTSRDLCQAEIRSTTNGKDGWRCNY